MVRPRRITVSAAPVFMSMPSPENTEMPAYAPGDAIIDTDLVIWNGPYPAESSTMTSPPQLVCDTAWVNVRQGAARLHGLPSLPRPDTKVRWTWARPGEPSSTRTRRPEEQE